MVIARHLELPPKVNLFRFNSIGGSRGCVPGASHPLWDLILSFSHTFSVKSARIRGPHPLMGARPLWKILDPPLNS